MNRYEMMGLVARSGKNKQLTNRLILTLTNSFAQEILKRFNAYEGDRYEYKFLQVSDFINNNYEKFKDELFIGIRSLFTVKELRLLHISDASSRNYDIAIKKLANHYKMYLNKEGVAISFTENSEIVLNVLDYISINFNEMTDPNQEKLHTAKDRQKFTRDYNAISEMFIK